MATGNTTVPSERSPKTRAAAIPERACVEIMWSDGFSRSGEVAFLEEGKVQTLGRGGTFVFTREGPGTSETTGRLTSMKVSQDQLGVRLEGKQLHLENRGAARLRVNGAECARATLELGQPFELAGHYVLLFTKRPIHIPACRHWPFPPHPYGTPDRYGSVGESPLAWSIRERLALLALADDHVLIHGESGTGKELAANAIHYLSRRAAKPLVVRNAAGFPEGVAEAELFGYIKNFTHTAPENIGLFGAAEGGSLFLDEIGDMSRKIQHLLLRAMDGDIQRLGEQITRKCDVLVIGATNSPLTSLEGDVFGRFDLLLETPSLNERRDNIPHLIRQLVLAAISPEIARRFIRNAGSEWPDVAISPEFIEALLRHHFTLHVRELKSLLTRGCIESQEEDAIMMPKGFVPAAAPKTPRASKRPTEEEVRAALAAHDNNQTQAAAALGISRWVLRDILGL